MQNTVQTKTRQYFLSFDFHIIKKILSFFLTLFLFFSFSLPLFLPYSCSLSLSQWDSSSNWLQARKSLFIKVYSLLQQHYSNRINKQIRRIFILSFTWFLYFISWNASSQPQESQVNYNIFIFFSSFIVDIFGVFRLYWLADKNQ